MFLVRQPRRILLVLRADGQHDAARLQRLQRKPLNGDERLARGGGPARARCRLVRRLRSRRLARVLSRSSTRYWCGTRPALRPAVRVTIVGIDREHFGREARLGCVPQCRGLHPTPRRARPWRRESRDVHQRPMATDNSACILAICWPTEATSAMKGEPVSKRSKLPNKASIGQQRSARAAPNRPKGAGPPRSASPARRRRQPGLELRPPWPRRGPGPGSAHRARPAPCPAARCAWLPGSGRFLQGAVIGPLDDLDRHAVAERRTGDRRTEQGQGSIAQECPA